MPIPLVELGRTGLEVSRIGVGMAALGRPGYINLGHADDLDGDYGVAGMARRARIVLDAAWAAGVRYFDAARSYGRGEQFLAEWLAARAVAPGEAAVGSKWGYVYTADWKTSAEDHEIKDHTLPVLAKQYVESRELLGERLGLYQIHSATLESGVLERSDVLAELARLRSQGVAIGLSLSGPAQAATLARAMEIRIDGEPLFDSVQATWNLLETSAGERLAEAHDRGLGVIVKEALANGRLTARNLREPDRTVLSTLQATAQELDVGVDAVALAAVLAQPWVDVVLSGAATAEHLHENLRATAVEASAIPLDRLASLRQDPGEYWATRSGLEWN